MIKPEPRFDYNEIVGKPGIMFRHYPTEKANLASRRTSRRVAYLDTVKVAKQLGIGRQQVSNLASAGKLKGEKNASGKFVFRQDDVDAYVAGQEQSRITAAKQKLEQRIADLQQELAELRYKLGQLA
jgi:uncharacterized protein YceH (UPF0502 family)